HAREPLQDPRAPEASWLAVALCSRLPISAGSALRPTRSIPRNARRSVMSVRNIYLKIEEIADYSPVEPSSHAAANYRRDCMRNPGHEDGRIPLSEVQTRRLVALVYREYLDSGYLLPKPDKLVQADINEPIFPHRVPGAVVYTS